MEVSLLIKVPFLSSMYLLQRFCFFDVGIFVCHHCFIDTPDPICSPMPFVFSGVLPSTSILI